MRRIIVCFVFLINFSCKYNEIPKPEKLLSEQEMESIMFDIAILNAAKSSDNRLLKTNGIVPTEFIYQKHNIDSIQFAENSIYYAAQPDIYKTIIDNVSQRIQHLKDSLYPTDTTSVEKIKEEFLEDDIQELPREQF